MKTQLPDAVREGVARAVGKREKRGRIYVSGPMTGYEAYNFPAFDAKSEELEAEGWDVENPAEKGEVDGWDWADYLRYDIRKLMDCDAIYMLKGWRSSRGADLEHAIAKALGFTIFYEGSKADV